eukprot:260353_1
MLRSIHSAPTALSRELSNSEATQLLKKLYASNQNAQSPSNIAQNAFKIYNNVYERKDKYVINTLLKVLFQHKQSHQISKIWKDIQQTTNISYILLLKSCVQSKPIHMDRCMQVLKWTRQSMHNHPLQPYEIADFSINVSKLIKLSHKSPHNLKQIYSWFGDTDDIFIKTAFIDSFGKIRQIPIAENVFQSIKEHNKNIITINAMMTAYLKNAQYHNVIQLHEQYRCNELIDDTSVLLAIKACTNTKDYTKGMDIIRDHNVNTASIELRNTLIEFYGSCGDIKRAFDTFDHISDDTRDVFALSNIMKACIANDMNLKALELYDTYHALNDNVSHLLALKACINLNNIHKGKEIHAHISDASIEVLNTLIHFYGHCGDVSEAIEVFNTVPKTMRNSVTYGALMKVFINHDRNKEALELYDKCTTDTLCNGVTDLLAIKACMNVRDYDQGHQILNKYDINDRYQYFTIELRCVAIDFYGHFNDISNAKLLFNSIDNDDKDVVCIGCMMKALSNNHYDEDALRIYDEYTELHNDILHLQAIHSCIKRNDLSKGKHIHQTLQNNSNIKIKSALIDFYGHCGDLSTAWNIFDSIGMSQLNVICVNSMMTALVHNGKYEEVLTLYGKYFDSFLNDTSHILAIKACINTKNTDKWNDTQCTIMSHPHRCVELSNALIDCYGFFGDIENATHVFNHMEDTIKDEVSVNSMMNVLIDHELYKHALNIYDRYKELRDNITNVLAIKACTNVENYERGMQIHHEITEIDRHTCSTNAFLNSALVDLYGNARDMETAEDVFRCIEHNRLNIVCLNSMMEAYCKNDLNSECLRLFDEIKHINHCHPDTISYAIAFKACTNGSCIQIGQRIHDELAGDMNVNKEDVSVNVHLMNMYGKFGMIGVCEEIFNAHGMSNDVGIWNAMIHAYGRNGDIDAAKHIYERMKTEVGLKPNLSSFVLLLNACSHCGDIDKAIEIYERDIDQLDIKYDEYVVTNLIDCYSRNGLLMKAYQLILKYEQFTDSIQTEIMWTSLLSGCKKYDNKTMASTVYEEMCKRFEAVKDKKSSVSILLSNFV